MDFALTEEQKTSGYGKNFAENEIKPHVEEDEKKSALAQGNIR